jgi:hypothetical protein
LSNTILTPQIITNELLRRFQNNLGFAKAVHHEDWSEHFAKPGAKIGDTLSLRDPVRFAAVDGANLVIQDVEERKIPLVINQRKHTAFSFTSAEQTLSIDRIGERYIEGAAIALSNAAEVVGLTVAYQATPNVVGTPGSVPNGSTAFQTYLSALEALDRNSAPIDEQRYMVIASKFQTQIIDTLKGLFQSSEQIKKQYLKGRMGTGAGFDWLLAQNIRTHTIGSGAGTPVVNGAGQTGSALVINGLTPNAQNVYNAGDVFTLGVGGTPIYAVNPVSGDTLSDLRQFVVTAPVNADGSGNGVVPIYPAIAVGTNNNGLPNPYATCNTTPLSGAALTLFGTAGTLTPQAMAFHKEAYAWACVPLDLPRAVEMAKRATDPATGMSIRTVSQYDIVNDIFATRCDIMFGWVAQRGDWGVRICG